MTPHHIESNLRAEHVPVAFLSVHAQSPSWAKAVGSGSLQDQVLMGLASTAGGSIHTVGRFYDWIAIGDIEVEMPSGFTPGNIFPYLSKVTPAGEAAGIMNFSETDMVHNPASMPGLATDIEGYVYISRFALRGSTTRAFDVNKGSVNASKLIKP